MTPGRGALGVGVLQSAALSPVGAVTAQVVVYGATPGGIAAAVAAKRHGLNVIIVGGWRENRLGGMMAGGLSATDLDNDAALGGLGREFFDLIDAAYSRAPGTYFFEPKVARSLFEQWVATESIPVYWSRGICGARKTGARLERIITRDGGDYRASIFIDASYEGDLLAFVGVGYRVDREASSEYGESYAGWIALNAYTTHNFYEGGAYLPTSAYVTPGVPGSGLLPRVRQMAVPAAGTGDSMVQAYNFRMTLTNQAANRRPFPTSPPRNYSAANYELTGRWLEARAALGIVINRSTTFIAGPTGVSGKGDYNARGALSTDPFGENWLYGDAGFATAGQINYALREQIWQAHIDHHLGFLWWICFSGDPRVDSTDLANQMRTFNFCYDEHADPWPGDPAGFPPQLYVREARRMVSDYVMTQSDVLLPDASTPSYAAETIALASYAIDSHHVVTYVDGSGYARNQGGIQANPPGDEMFEVPYSAIRPKQSECDNLLTPWSVSATHVAFGAIRMEPTSLCLGHACGLAAVLALDGVQSAVQEIDVSELRTQLLAEGAAL